MTIRWSTFEVRNLAIAWLFLALKGEKVEGELYLRIPHSPWMWHKSLRSLSNEHTNLHSKIRQTVTFVESFEQKFSCKSKLYASIGGWTILDVTPPWSASHNLKCFIGEVLVDRFTQPQHRFPLILSHLRLRSSTFFKKCTHYPSLPQLIEKDCLKSCKFTCTKEKTKSIHNQEKSQQSRN